MNHSQIIAYRPWTHAMNTHRRHNIIAPAHLIANSLGSQKKSDTELCSLSMGAICPITHEAIDQFPPQDIFVAHPNVAYHQPSLKRWLQSHHQMPHSGKKISDEELLQIWPNIRAIRTDIEQSKRAYNRRHLTLLIQSTIAISYGSVFAAYAFVAKSLILTLRGKNLCDDSLCAISVSVASVFFGIHMFLSLEANKLFAAATKPQYLAFQMTAEEIKKAQLGIGYYKT